jgi:hypothetical protein
VPYIFCQLSPLPIITINPLAVTNVPARLIVAGRVSACGNLHQHWFEVSVAQPVKNASLQSSLRIHAVLDLNVLPHIQTHRLPHTNSFVSFTGDVLSVTSGTAFVAVDDVSFLPQKQRQLLTSVAVYL